MAVLPAPGFLRGELLPATLEVAVETQADAVQLGAAGAPVVLLGHSTGGLLAYAVASHLERIGVRPAAVVLIDTYPMSTLYKILPGALDGMFEREEAGVSINDIRLTAMGAYGRLLAEWEPTQIATPTLLLKATKPIAYKTRAPEGPSWPFPHCAVDVPGDHFTIMEAHASATARAVEDWLLSTLGL